jgi:Na+/glutamate symporter
MRYLKRVVVCTLVYTALYLIFIAILQAMTGYDYTAAYGVGGIAGVGEAALCSIIKIIELKEIKGRKLATNQRRMRTNMRLSHKQDNIDNISDEHFISDISDNDDNNNTFSANSRGE